MNKAKTDFIAEAIADYEAMRAEEQGKLIVRLFEDQPIMMGFITNLSDDFTEQEHEALVDSTAILINAFVSAGIPVEMIPHALVEEVVTEKVEAYGKKDQAQTENRADSPLVFEDLKNRAVFKSGLAGETFEKKQNFSLALDTIISMIERSVADQFKDSKE